MGEYVTFGCATLSGQCDILMFESVLDGPMHAILKDAGGSIALHFTSDDTQGEFRTFETVITLPATFATQRNAHSPKG